MWFFKMVLRYIHYGIQIVQINTQYFTHAYMTISIVFVMTCDRITFVLLYTTFFYLLYFNTYILIYTITNKDLRYCFLQWFRFVTEKLLLQFESQYLIQDFLFGYLIIIEKIFLCTINCKLCTNIDNITIQSISQWKS